MPKKVTVPGVGDVDFPDGMSDADITRAIETDILPHAKTSGAVAAPEPSGGGGDYVAAVAKGLAHLVGLPTEIPKTPADALRATSALLPNVYGDIQQGVDL